MFPRTVFTAPIGVGISNTRNADLPRAKNVFHSTVTPDGPSPLPDSEERAGTGNDVVPKREARQPHLRIHGGPEP